VGDQLSRIGLAVLLLCFGAYRLLLAQSGQLYWPDEYRYLHALHVLDELRKGEISQGLHWIFGVEAGVASRPSYILISLVPAALQGVANLVFQVQPDDAAFYRIPAIANVAVSLGVAGTLYYLIWSLSGDRLMAWAGTAVHGLLANTNMYVRHLFPYDESLLLFLLSLGILLRQGSPSSIQRAGLAGVLSGAAATVYPGYSLFLFVPLAALLADRPVDWRSVMAFGGAAAAVGLFWEMIARVGGFSFIGASKRFSKTFTPARPEDLQGSYEEGFTFLPIYLAQVEGLAGILLCLLVVVFLFMAARKVFARRQVAIVMGTVASIVLFAATVQVWHRALFYGRIVHMFLPMMVLAAMLVLAQLRLPWARYGGVGLMLAASILSFIPVAASGLEIRFPKDLGRELSATYGSRMKICGMDGHPDGSNSERLDDCDLFLEHARHLYPLPESWRSSPPPGFVPLRQFPHPMQFRPYWYEGFTPEERRRLAETPPVISLYRKVERA
jgi:hypothetical protein